MTKEEIYEAIGYQGKYNKEVKRKLRLLMKKFHPDLNHDDDQTMRLLVEVKGELLSNKVTYVKKEAKKENATEEREEYEDITKDDFSKVSIQELTNKVNHLLDDMEKFQKDLYGLYKKMTKEESEYLKLGKEYKTNISDINISKEEMMQIKQNHKIEIVFLGILVVHLFLFFFKFHFLILFSLLGFIFLYIFFYLFRIAKINIFTDKMYDLEIDGLIIKKNLEKQEDIVHELKRKEGSLKRNIQRIKDDITFYNNVIFKKTNKTRNYEYNHKNVYTKRK